MAILNRNKKQPTQDLMKEIGAAGDVLFTGYENEEARADNISIKKYREMLDRDPTVESLFNIFTLPIVAATSRIDADEDDDGEVQADFVRNNLLEPPHKGGMESPFTLFQDQLLLAIVDGFALWEKVYKLDNGRYVYKKLAYRDSIGITLKRDKDGGYGGARQIVSYGGEPIDITLEPYKTFLFTHNKARDYLYGRSAFRSLRRPYEKKAKLEYLDSIALQADAIKPKVLVHTQPGTVGDNDSDGKPKASGVVSRILNTLAKLGERNAVASIPYGYDIKEITQKGRDPHQSIERQNSEMARAFLATFTLLGSQGGSNVGSYALSDNLSDMLMISLKAFMTKVEEHVNQYLIADLINLNFANPHYPEFHYDDLTSDTVQVIADAFQKLLEKDRISDEMVEGIEEATANRLEINLEQIKKDRKMRAEQETNGGESQNSPPGSKQELSDVSSRDFPGLYDGLANEDKLGCIMLDLQTFDIQKHVEGADADLYVTDEAHSGGAVAETEAHVTLLYGLMQNGNLIKDKVDRVLDGWKLDSVVIADVGSFEVAPDAPSVPIVAYVSTNSIYGAYDGFNKLKQAHDRLALLPHINTFGDYQPHVTLAYVKNDPDIVQKWVKALGDALRGMRLSVTGLNYGDQPENEDNDDEGGAASSGGKFPGKQLSDGQQWWRALTPAEQTVRFADINKRMDGMEQQLLDDLQPIVSKVLADITSRAASADSNKVLDFNVTLPAEYQRTLLATIRTAYNYAKTGAADELKVPAPATGKDAIDGMQQLAAFVVSKQQNDLTSLVQAELLKANRTKQLADEGTGENLSPIEQFKATLEALLGTWFAAKLQATASAVVSQGVNNGRDDVFAAVAENGDRFQYSSLMDSKVCNTCRGLDGKVVDLKEYRRTQWKPPIHFHCRCIWVLIRKLVKGESDVAFPDVTGMPAESGGMTGPAI